MSNFVHSVEIEQAIDLDKVTGYKRDGNKVIFTLDENPSITWYFNTTHAASSAITELFSKSSERLFL